MRMGWKKFQAAAIVGAAQQESYKDLRSEVAGDHGHSWGVFQWNGPRLNKLKEFSTKLGRDWLDFDLQLSFVVYELDTTERLARNKLREATTLVEAVKAFMGYERPAGFTWEHPELGDGFKNRLSNATALAGNDETRT